MSWIGKSIKIKVDEQLPLAERTSERGVIANGYSVSFGGWWKCSGISGDSCSVGIY